MSEFVAPQKAMDIVQKAIDSFGKSELKISRAPKIFTFVIDTSGSTCSAFTRGMIILEKEQEVIMQFIIKNSSENPEDKYYLYSFAGEEVDHGWINFLAEEGFVDLPPMVSNNTTETSKPLEKIYERLNIVKPDEIIIITDGQTNPGRLNIDKITDTISKLKNRDVKIHVVAVTRGNANLENLTEREELNLPGMDLINLVRNNIDELEIYNSYHENEPYKGAMSSQVDKNKITFMGVPIDVPVIHFLNTLVEKICETEPSSVNWGPGQNELKKLLVEFGKLWSLLIIEFDKEHPFMISTLEVFERILPIESERIIKLIAYGVKCTKNNQPILLTNLENHIKEASVKKNQFADGVNSLERNGTTLGCNKLISFPNTSGICLITSEEDYPVNRDYNNICKDKFGNIFFGVPNEGDSSLDQAIRIGIRNCAVSFGFQNPRGSPDVIFFVASEIVKLVASGHELDSKYVSTLQRLAIIQCSMEGMVSKGKYDGIGFFLQWKAGTIPKKHFSNPETHTACHSCQIINPFGFSEPIWWASMMFALGIFNEQLPNYKNSIESLGIEPTDEGFKNFLKSHPIEGNVQFYEITAPKKSSIFTLEDFPPGEPIYVFEEHRTRAGQICSTDTWYSQNEVDKYLNTSGCVWCRTIPTEGSLRPVVPTDPEKIVSKMATECRPLRVTSKTQSISALSGMMDSLSLSTIPSDSNKYVLYLAGVTGAGKTTSREIIIEILRANNIKYVVASPDDEGRKGLKGKGMANKIRSSIEKLDNLKNGLKKFVIIDVCNERGVDDRAFGFNFIRNGYHKIVFYPNLNTDMFKQYCAWCLRNILSRKKCDRNSNYSLNPEEQSVSVCIKVHNMKAEGIRRVCGTSGTNINVLESDTLGQVLAKINNDAEEYAAYLTTLNHRDTIVGILKNNLVIE
jgi:hypothetical protein